ncbi:serine-rich adhesin for platelets-like [Drosophila subpulchrella]|uniref:serine-rich adhesin for platelets-like n=1 Tax=Drosophila subpulchrella TaxID=1486046 RepID=UPI0018A17BFC|nr:serine-rich adhesin for platelets-like [Drosophila subpulchrella]
MTQRGKFTMDRFYLKQGDSEKISICFDTSQNPAFKGSADPCSQNSLSQKNPAECLPKKVYKLKGKPSSPGQKILEAGKKNKDFASVKPDKSDKHSLSMNFPSQKEKPSINPFAGWFGYSDQSGDAVSQQSLFHRIFSSSGSQAASPEPSSKSSSQVVNRIGGESKSGSQFRKNNLFSKKQRRLSKKDSSQSETSNDKQPNHSRQCGSSKATHFEFVRPSRGHIFSSSKSGSSMPRTSTSSQSDKSNSFSEKTSQSGKCPYCNKDAFPSGICKSNPEHIFLRLTDLISGKLRVVKEPTVSLDNGHSFNEESLPSETERSDCSEISTLTIVPSSPTKEYNSAGESTSESEITLRNETSARSSSKSSERERTSDSEKTLRNETSARSLSKSPKGLYSAMENTAESEKTLKDESSARSHCKSSASKNTSESEKTLRNQTSARSHSKSSKELTSESENALRNETPTRSRSKSSNRVYSESKDHVDLNDLLDESENTRFYRQMVGLYFTAETLLKEFTKRKAVEFKERRDRRFPDLTKKR